MMRVSVSSPESLPRPVIPCEHCGAPTNGSYQVFVHVADNPPDGRVSVNVISPGHQFCSAACRDAWWNVPTTDALIPRAELLTSKHPLSVTVCRVEPSNRHLSVFIEDDTENLIAEQSGEPSHHHRFANRDHVEAWWRGEVEAEEEPMRAPGKVQ